MTVNELFELFETFELSNEERILNKKRERDFSTRH